MLFRSDFLKFWDTGFRAFFKDALNIKNQLKEKNLLLSVKPLIVDVMKSYFYRFVENPFSDKGGFAMVVAKKV